MLNWLKTNLLKHSKLELSCVVFIFIVLSIVLSRAWNAEVLKKNTNKNAIDVVQVIHPKPNVATEQITLPGSLLAWHEATLYARVKGYIKTWYVDIGYQVKKGDVLAIIEAPELDAKLRAAKDQVSTILAQYKLAKITANRWRVLLKTDSVSKQANDDKFYEAAALQALLKKAQANLDNLRAYVGFETIIAPFDGIISQRNTDIGKLINVGSGPMQSAALFDLVQTNPLRLYVNIPQTYVGQLKPNMQVSLSFAEHPGKVFSAQLLKYSGAINTNSLTLQAEFKVDNQTNILLPGSYTSVTFSLQTPPDSVILPINTLIFQSHGLQVATVDTHQRVLIKSIEIGTDFGDSIQINHGISPKDSIIINPLDTLYTGQKVRVHAIN